MRVALDRGGETEREGGRKGMRERRRGEWGARERGGRGGSAAPQGRRSVPLDEKFFALNFFESFNERIALLKSGGSRRIYRDVCIRHDTEQSTPYVWSRSPFCPLENSEFLRGFFFVREFWWNFIGIRRISSLVSDPLIDQVVNHIYWKCTMNVYFSLDLCIQCFTKYYICNI